MTIWVSSPSLPETDVSGFHNMKYIKMLLVALTLSVGALSMKAEYISDSSSSNSWGEEFRYYWDGGDYGTMSSYIWFTSYSFSAWYDTDTGNGYYSYTVWNGSSVVSIEMVASGGWWTQTSWYWEGPFPGPTFFFGPSFTQDFWQAVAGPPVW